VALVQGIIDTANVPRITSLTQSEAVPSALANPLTGRHLLYSFDAGVPAYGIQWSVFDFPPGAGRRARAITTFEVPWLSLACAYHLANDNYVFGEELLTGVSDGWLLFEHGQPERVQLDMSPGWSAYFTWLIAP
jgi:hypothetical protein